MSGASLRAEVFIPSKARCAGLTSIAGARQLWQALFLLMVDPGNACLPALQAHGLVHGDVRPIMSKTTSTGFSLRFPRITRCREDKGPLQCQSIREFETMYEERKKDESERTGNAEKSSEAMRNYRKEMEAKRKKRKELIPAAFKPANLEGEKQGPVSANLLHA
eukprot:1158477-Pelagomonas_calceolata.AAC.2